MLIKETGEVENKTIYNKSAGYLTTIGYASEGIILILLGFTPIRSDGLRGLVFLSGFLCLMMVPFSISFFFQKYEVTEAGIWAKYPFESKFLIPWHEFQQVCVCYARGNKIGSAFQVICFVKHGEKVNSRGRWNTDNFLYYRSVITVDYTFELYKKVKKMCPYEVVDLRNTPEYRHVAFGYHEYHRKKQQEKGK